MLGVDNALPEYVTICFQSRDAVSDQSDLASYLEQSLGVKIRQDLRESVNLQDAILYLKPAAVPLAIYAGTKLVDVLTAKLRTWMQDKPQIPGIVLYDAEGNVIEKITRKT